MNNGRPRPLALSVPISNKIYHRTKVGQCLKLKPVSKLYEPALRTTMTSPQSGMDSRGSPDQLRFVVDAQTGEMKFLKIPSASLLGI